MATYNGYRSWNAWNVSLWLNNCEDSQNLMKDYIRKYRTIDKAAREMANDLAQCSPRTPDGARYNAASIREAMRGLM